MKKMHVFYHFSWNGVFYARVCAISSSSWSGSSSFRPSEGFPKNQKSPLKDIAYSSQDSLVGLDGIGILRLTGDDSPRSGESGSCLSASGTKPCFLPQVVLERRGL